MRILVNCMKKTVSMEIVNYADIPIPQFVDIILKGDDEAMYYLLHERLKHLLFERYQDYSHNLYDDFDDLLDDFSNLYPILFDYYIQCIDTLKTSDAVKELRSQYIEERGFVVHEPSAPEQSRISIVRFWVKLNRWLIPGMMAM